MQTICPTKNTEIQTVQNGGVQESFHRLQRKCKGLIYKVKQHRFNKLQKKAVTTHATLKDERKVNTCNTEAKSQFMQSTSQPLDTDDAQIQNILSISVKHVSAWKFCICLQWHDFTSWCRHFSYLQSLQSILVSTRSMCTMHVWIWRSMQTNLEVFLLFHWGPEGSAPVLMLLLWRQRSSTF